MVKSGNLVLFWALRYDVTRGVTPRAQRLSIDHLVVYLGCQGFMGVRPMSSERQPGPPLPPDTPKTLPRHAGVKKAAGVVRRGRVAEIVRGARTESTQCTTDEAMCNPRANRLFLIWLGSTYPCQRCNAGPGGLLAWAGRFAITSRTLVAQGLVRVVSSSSLRRRSIRHLRYQSKQA